MPASSRGGLGLAVASAATFGTSGSFATSLIDAGWSPAAAVTLRISTAALLLTMPALISLRGRWRMLRASAPLVAAYGLVAVAGCQLFYFNALSHLSVGVALLLEYLGTVLVVGWLWARHHQRPRRLTVSGAVAAMIGLVLVLDVTGGQRLDAVGVFWGLAAAVGLAVYFTLSAQTVDPVPPLVMTWAGMVVGAVALATLGGLGALPVHAGAAQVSFGGHQVSWVVPVLGLSVIAAALAYVTGIAAARSLGSKVASFIGLLEVVFAVLFAWLFLGQLPTSLQMVGGVFIVGGAALVRLDEREGMAQPLEVGPHAGELALTTTMASAAVAERASRRSVVTSRASSDTASSP